MTGLQEGIDHAAENQRKNGPSQDAGGLAGGETAVVPAGQPQAQRSGCHPPTGRQQQNDGDGQARLG